MHGQQLELPKLTIWEIHMKRLLPVLVAAFSIAAAQGAPGELHDVGGHSLHMYCTGEAASTPTVILDAGLGDWSLQMRNLQDEVSDFARVCSYDRAGYGWSEPGPQPRTSDVLVDELVALLAASGEQGPYLFVGHSFGGANMIGLAHDHPELTAGVLLLDASHPEQLERLAEVPALLLLQDMEIEGLAQLSLAAAAGELGAADVMEMVPAGVPEELHDVWAEQFLHSGSLQAAVDEYDSIDASLEWVGERYDLGDLPLGVVARDAGISLPPEILEALGINQADLDRAEEIWRDMQLENAALSTNSRFEVAEASPHYVHYFQLGLVTDLLHGLIDANAAF